MPVVQEISEGLVPVKLYTGDIEPAARRQLVNVSRLPDVHLGIGATVGCVIPTLRAIIPAAVGVDIGCGMIAVRLSLSGNQLEEKALDKVFHQISRDVPVGFKQHDERDARIFAVSSFEKKLHKIKRKHPGIEKRVGKHSSWVRQMGNAIGTYFIELARKDAERNQVRLPDRDLAYFPEGVWLTRKGAIRARAGDLGIIPGSMGARSYIVRGRGSAESFDSCAHGAGRRMSRTQAEKRFSIGDLETQTEGVICRKDKGVLDEIPGAYKDIGEVMANQSDLVEVVHTLKQVLCVKG
jgi:RNA-splicing ligase RtcB